MNKIRSKTNHALLGSLRSCGPGLEKAQWVPLASAWWQLPPPVDVTKAGMVLRLCSTHRFFQLHHPGCLRGKLGWCWYSLDRKGSSAICKETVPAMARPADLEDSLPQMFWLRAAPFSSSHYPEAGGGLQHALCELRSPAEDDRVAAWLSQSPRPCAEMGLMSLTISPKARWPG